MCRSGARDTTEIPKGHLRGDITIAVVAICGVTPRTEQPRARGIEKDDEGLGVVLDDETVVGPPLGRHRRRVGAPLRRTRQKRRSAVSNSQVLWHDSMTTNRSGRAGGLRRVRPARPSALVSASEATRAPFRQHRRTPVELHHPIMPRARDGPAARALQSREDPFARGGPACRARTLYIVPPAIARRAPARSN